MDLRLASFSSELKPRGGFTLCDATVSLRWLHMNKLHTHTHTHSTEHIDSVGAAVAILFLFVSFLSAFPLLALSVNFGIVNLLFSLPY